MMKKITMAVLAAAFLASCSNVMPTEKYIATMAALGCANAMETSPEGEKILKEQGVTQEEIQAYRKKMDPKKVMDISREIVTRVAACHGVKM